MKKIFTQRKTTTNAIKNLEFRATNEEWSLIEESLIMARFKANLNLEPSLLNALIWPLDRKEYIEYLHQFRKWIPQKYSNDVWNKPTTLHSQEVFDRLCHFFFLLDQKTGEGYLRDRIEWLDDFITNFTDNWGYYMNSSKSFDDDFLTQLIKDKPAYRIQDSFLNGRPNTFWNCYNDFFARELNPGLRPIKKQHDNRIVTSPSDGVFLNKLAIDAIGAFDSITLKQTHTFENVQDLLSGSKYADSFHNGTLVHYYLEAHSYHRFHTPVAGLIKESYPLFDQEKLAIEIDEAGSFQIEKNTLDGYQFSQARGILTIDTKNSPNGDIGIVAVIPIGMCQISSVHMLATPDTTMDKGEEFGYFKFGGSDVILLFQEGKAPIINESKDYRHYGESISDYPSKHY